MRQCEHEGGDRHGDNRREPAPERSEEQAPEQELLAYRRDQAREQGEQGEPEAVRGLEIPHHVLTLVLHELGDREHQQCQGDLQHDADPQQPGVPDVHGQAEVGAQ